MPPKRGKRNEPQLKKPKYEPENDVPAHLTFLERVKNKNIVNFLKQTQSGNVSSVISDQIKRWAVIKQVSDFSAIQETFIQRITAICWHHAISQQNVIAVGIKNGYILIGKVCQITKEFKHLSTFDEIGKGFAIYALKFDPQINENIYSACWDGSVTLKNVENGLSSVILSKTFDNQWFTSIDVSKDGDFLISGCTAGRLHMVDRNGKILFNNIIHTQRILSVQLCPRDKNLLATTSLDRTVKLWDLRYIKDKSSYTMSLQHSSPPAVAAFSQTGCNQLLTSDQYKEIRVYSASNWKLLNIIEHPHRQFMHITPIRASWHPTSDIIIIGRYPDPSLSSYTEGEPRTIDFFCPAMGKTLYQLIKSGVSQCISSINIFNNTGNILATGRALKNRLVSFITC
ncbi:DNA damage-binding protein 2-like isoform X3 [Lycorma delicatula]|uniref:DNA damage-binding protein 2-like isoform X3 n=1 Tax=Lycorma delicatula TaxID=130591 RepID=UPI003F5105F2